MRITLLNGEPDPGSAFQALLDRVVQRLEGQGHQITRLTLRDLELKGCSGCWGCWVKTPGACVKGDASGLICAAVLEGDLLLAASPVSMGFTSSLMKKALDQMIALIHPYFMVEGGEVHHRRRYPAYPALAVLLAAGPGCDEEDLEITAAIWCRLGRNLKFRSVAVRTAGTDAGEVADGLVAVA